MANRFVVDLGTIKLNAKQRQAIEAAIQSAAISVIGTIDTKGDLISRFPRDWMGIWIDRVPPAKLKGLPDINTIDLVKLAKR